MSKVINYKFKSRNTIGNNEIKSVQQVMKLGKLSDFLAEKGEKFLGGTKVKLFEKKLAKFYSVKHAITVNSWTSGLICAVGALNIEPGDEIITTPWTMCATSTAILHWNAIPIFADIDPKTFCIDPESVKKKITNKTKAIIAVDIFGLSHDVDKLKKVVKNKNIKIICDSAQAPYSFYKKKLAGTMNDIGGYSFNFHKHINTGEGGCLVTNNNKYAKRLRLLRNHAEAIVTEKDELNNMIGFNFRLGEIESTIGIEQLKKLKRLVKQKQYESNFITKNIKHLKGLKVPEVPKICSHSYYIYPILLDEKILKNKKSKIINLLKKEGVQGLSGSYGDVHLLPVFRKKIAYGKKNFPWKLSNTKIKNKNNSCKIAENLNRNNLLIFEICLYDFTKKDLILICKAFIKVWKKLGLLKNN